MSTFDPESFLNQESEGAIDTKIIPIPMGDWPAQIDGIKAREIQSSKTGDTYLVMDVLWNVMDDKVKEETGMEKPICRQSIFVDLTEEGAIDMSKGKNRQLGLLREAVKQNKDGKPWNPMKLMGSTATIKVEHSFDEKDPENIFSNVVKVGAL